MTPALRRCTAALALCALLVGCGRDPRADVRRTLGRFVSATQRHDYRTLCRDLFASNLLAKLRVVNVNCELALAAGLGGVRQPTLSVLRVTISGDRAHALVRSGAAGQRPLDGTVGLVKEHGSWRVAQLAAGQPAAQGAPARRVPSTSLRPIGPTHGAVAPASP